MTDHYADGDRPPARLDKADWPMWRHICDDTFGALTAAHGRRDVVKDGEESAGRAARQGQRQKGLRDIGGGHLMAQQVAAHILRLGHAVRGGARGDHLRGQEAAADAIGIDGVRADAGAAVFERVLPHQRQRRRFRETVRAEIRAGADRLLRDIEQQAAAGLLRRQDPQRVLCDALMREEIELEGLAQQLVVDIADAALPGGACVGDHDVDSAKFFRNRGEGAAHRRCIRDITAEAERGAADLFGDRFRGRFVAVENGHLRPAWPSLWPSRRRFPNRRP